MFLYLSTACGKLIFLMLKLFVVNKIFKKGSEFCDAAYATLAKYYHTVKK